MSPITLTIEQRDDFQRTLAKLHAWHECVMLFLREDAVDADVGFGLDLFFEAIDADFQAFLPDGRKC